MTPERPDHQLEVPPFVTFHDVTRAGATEPEFVLTNDATGKYFTANRSTVHFIEALRQTGSVGAAFARAEIEPTHRQNLVNSLMQAGIIVEKGSTKKAQAHRAPLESKLISLRFDLIDGASAARAFSGLGRAAFSGIGVFVWALSVIACGYQLVINSDKVAISLRSLPDMGWWGAVMFVLIYCLLKVIHEMGHALAYRTFCLRTGIEPGPIRMGIAIFAMTPFPFTDVTGAWRLRSDLHRAAIGAGGMYFETWAITILTLIWSQVQSGPVQTIILQVAVIAGFVTLLFNLNPAVKLDGYYILTDMIRRPNLAMRSSKAARAFCARLLGADEPLNRFDFGYWILSYLYRVTIFAGIFWIAYQFDPRFSVVVAGISIMMLVVRPLWSTVGYIRSRQISPRRAILVGLSGVGAAVLALVPFPDRLLLSGQIVNVETRFVEPPETGLLQTSPSGFVLQSPQLVHDRKDVGLRISMIENTKRTVSATAGEQAALDEDLKQLRQTADQIGTRLAQLDLTPEAGAVWTGIDGEKYLDAWVARGSVNLGAVSVSVTPYLELGVPQNRLEQDLEERQVASVRVRLVHDTSCVFDARLRSLEADLASVQNLATFRADPQDMPTCARDMRSGTAVVARLTTSPKSVLERVQITLFRVLQDRLPTI